MCIRDSYMGKANGPGLSLCALGGGIGCTNDSVTCVVYTRSQCQSKARVRRRGGKQSSRRKTRQRRKDDDVGTVAWWVFFVLACILFFIYCIGLYFTYFDDPDEFYKTFNNIRKYSQMSAAKAKKMEKEKK